MVVGWWGGGGDRFEKGKKCFCLMCGVACCKCVQEVECEWTPDPEHNIIMQAQRCQMHHVSPLGSNYK